ncbi:CaiB/BaiF CoA transferase family protein [Endozoicomonas lisbonensis]|uniref:Itaconate CoA-transferase n=1 Tax=Endozoicomonas lisbonensis TaxID=3120522 RepID=A0ABV2SJ68_9GAMM
MSDAKPLEGVLVVSIEQAVAAPLCTSRLAAAGARVIKVERPEGDFARGYDGFVKGEASYFVWINHGKESICLDLKQNEDRLCLDRILAEADVFVQNLSVGAVARLGFGEEELRKKYPRLITCSISGYGEQNEYRDMRAYDMLVQAESGLSGISGDGRMGISVADIVTGMNAHTAIVEALHYREKNGKGCSLSLSLFGSMTDIMAVPLLQQAYSGSGPDYIGMRHPSIVPYGAFPTSGSDVVISIQNEREWQRLCLDVLESTELASHPDFASNKLRTQHRQDVESAIGAITRQFSQQELLNRLRQAKIACGVSNTLAEVLEHPAYQSVQTTLPDGQVADIPALPAQTPWLTDKVKGCPELGADTDRIKAEFDKEVRA